MVKRRVKKMSCAQRQKNDPQLSHRRVPGPGVVSPVASPLRGAPIRRRRPRRQEQRIPSKRVREKRGRLHLPLLGGGARRCGPAFGDAVPGSIRRAAPGNPHRARRSKVDQLLRRATQEAGHGRGRGLAIRVAVPADARGLHWRGTVAPLRHVFIGGCVLLLLSFLRAPEEAS